MGLCGLVLVMGAATLPSQAATPAQGGPAWGTLTNEQRQVLMPLAKDWQQLDAPRKQKWLEVATRFPTMPADQQMRMQQRMTEWARMSPEQRGQARVNFQEAQQVPSQSRREKWDAYQALPQERKEALARQATRPMAGHAPGTGAGAPPSLRGAPLNAQAPKSNTIASVANPAHAPRPVAPALVQAGQGATTNLVTPTPHPPSLSQQVGKAKIEVNPALVDRRTLLPKSGPQAAGVTPRPGTAASPAKP
jgi:hypothetical protein